jgi:hypothetical protein
MTDVTNLVQQYRLLLRHIWNTCFWGDPALRDWRSVKVFDELKGPLFLALVADRLDPPPSELPPAGNVFGPSFRVVGNLRSESRPAFGSLYVDVGFDGSSQGKCWDHLVGPFLTDGIRLALIDFYDWTPLGYRDFRYYLVRIESFNDQPDKVGREAMVDVSEADVFWEDGVE